MAWFRMYDEVLDDPKVQRLTPTQFRTWVNLLCLSKRGNGVLPSNLDVAFALRISESKAVEVVAELIEAELFDVTESGVEPHKWGDRQYTSDVSTERVQRFRKRLETVSETPGETPPEQNRNRAEQNRAEREGARSKRGTRLPADWALSGADLEYAIGRGFNGQALDDVFETFVTYWSAGPGRNKTHMNWGRCWQSWIRREKPNGRANIEASRGGSSHSASTTGGLAAARRLHDGEPGGSGPRTHKAGPRIPTSKT